MPPNAAIEKPTDPRGLTLEAWAQGYMVGSLIVMAAITIANMRRRVLLHKLILIEVSPPLILPSTIFIMPRLSVQLATCDQIRHARRHAHVALSQ